MRSGERRMLAARRTLQIALMATGSGSVLLAAVGAHAQAASDDKSKGTTISAVTVTASQNGRLKTSA